MWLQIICDSLIQIHPLSCIIFINDNYKNWMDVMMGDEDDLRWVCPSIHYNVSGYQFCCNQSQKQLERGSSCNYGLWAAMVQRWLDIPVDTHDMFTLRNQILISLPSRQIVYYVVWLVKNWAPLVRWSVPSHYWTHKASTISTIYP